MDAYDYLRVSLDAHGDERSPRQQHADNLERCDENGWTFVRSYAEDGGISASDFSKKGRAAFENLLADIQNGTIADAVVIMWETSRLSRREREWLDLIDACERRRVRIHDTNDDRTYRPWNANDRESLVTGAAKAAAESRRLSERLTRGARRGAADGHGWGRPAYGYRTIYGPRGRATGRVIEPEEAKVVTDLFAHLANGGTVNSFAVDHGMSPQRVRGMALNPTYAGKRVHLPWSRKDSGPRPVITLDMILAAPDANWEALVDLDTFTVLFERLAKHKGKGKAPRDGKPHNLLSGIATCTCGETMRAGKDAKGRRVYRCASHQMIRADELDIIATRLALAFMEREGVQVASTATEADAAAQRAAEAAVAALEARFRDLEAQLATIEPGAALQAVVRALTATGKDLETARAAAAKASVPAALREHVGLAEKWNSKGFDLARKRAALKAIYSPEILGTLTILRNAHGGKPLPVEDRITLTRPA